MKLPASASLVLLAAAGCASPGAGAPEGNAPAVAPVEASAPAQPDEPRAGDRMARMEGYFPNTVLVSHGNEEVRFYDDLVRGKCVLIHFMYTVCDGI